MANKIDILDLMLDSEEESFPVPEDIPADKEDIGDLAERLKTWNGSCRDVFIDMSSVKFCAEEEDMYLSFTDKNFYSKNIYFKRDPDNPKDPRILHALKQFCKILGVPQPFFVKNRPTLRSNIVRTWQSGLSVNKSEKNQFIARVRESDTTAMLRAVVPVKYCPVHNHELMSIIKNDVPGIHLEFVSGDERDDIILHARFLFNEKFMLFQDTPVRIGFSLLCSEIGGGPLSVEVLIHDIEGSIAFIASYGTDAFFSSKYTGIQAQEIKEIFPKMLDRINKERSEMVAVIEKSFRAVEPDQEALKICKWGGIPQGFKKALLHEVSECEEDMKTSWDFARHISLIAKDFDTKNRIAIEKISGKYLNLVFPRS